MSLKNKLIKMTSPNHYNGRFGWKADVIGCHQSGTSTVTPALQWYMNPASQVCPNWMIDTNGDIYELVHPDNAAFANGTRTKPGDKLYYGYATSNLVRQRKTNANYFTYSIEFVHCAYGNINNVQIGAAVELIKEIIVPHMIKNGVTPKIDREHIIGHSEIAPLARPNGSCPGRQFPFQQIINCVNGVEKVPSDKTTAFCVGDKVVIKTTATTYAGAASNVKIPAVYKDGKKKYTIDKVSGEMSRLKELWSWVWNKDLEKKK